MIEFIFYVSGCVCTLLACAMFLAMTVSILVSVINECRNAKHKVEKNKLDIMRAEEEITLLKKQRGVLK